MNDLANLHEIARNIKLVGESGDWDEVARLWQWLQRLYDGYLILDGCTVRGLPER